MSRRHLRRRVSPATLKVSSCLSMILARPIRKHQDGLGTALAVIFMSPAPTHKKQGKARDTVYNIPPDTKSLPKNAGKARLPQGTLLGPNDFKKTEYGGPCPPIGQHRYFHKLYALDITLDLKRATKSQIEQAMKGHVLANAELIGTYQKGDR